MPAAQFKRDALVAEIVGGHVRVGRFLVVVPAILAAAGSDADGTIDAQTPAADVEGVDAVVAEFAGAPMPEPMPVVVNEIVVIFAFGCRSLPERVVEIGRSGRGFAMADRAAHVIVPAARKKDATDFTAADLLDGLDDSGHAAALRAELHLPVELARRGHHQFAFVRIVAGGFFDIDMFAG